jgi:multiple sugar transport system permease protein
MTAARARNLAGEARAMARGLAFLSPWLIGFSCFTLVPIALSLYYSFCRYSVLQPPLFRGLENYRDLMSDPVFWLSVRNTAIYSLMALPLGMIVALGAAMLLNTKIRGVSIYRTLVFLPSLVPQVAAAILWFWMFNAKLGLINTGLRAIGIKDPPNWLGDPHWAMPALVFMSLWGVGNTVVIYLAGLQDVPRELYEAADIDGASTLRKLWHVTLPGISPVIFFNLIIGIIGSLQLFAAPFILAVGGTGRDTYLFTMYLYDNAFNYTKMGKASAMAWVQLLLVLVLTGLAALSSRRWVHYQDQK